MIAFSLIEVKKFYAAKNLDIKEQPETNQIYTTLTLDGKEFIAFFREIPEAKIIQMITFLPFTFKEEHINETARLLLLFNKEISHPGFGIDEENRVIFFRCLIPAVNNKLSETLLNTSLQATRNALHLFSASIFAIATGQISYKELMEKAKQRES